MANSTVRRALDVRGVGLRGVAGSLRLRRSEMQSAEVLIGQR